MDKSIEKPGHGEKGRRVQWLQLKLAVSKCGGKILTTLMERSLKRCAKGWKHTSKSARTAKPSWMAPEMLWVWLATEGCFRCQRVSTSVYIKRFRVFRNFMLGVVGSALAGMGLRHLGYPCTSITSTSLLYFSARCPHSDPCDGLVDHRP